MRIAEQAPALTGDEKYQSGNHADVQARYRQQMTGAGFLQHPPLGCGHGAPVTDTQCAQQGAHGLRHVQLLNVCRQLLPQTLHRLTPGLVQAPVRLSFSHIAGCLDALCHQPALIIKAARVGKTARPLEADLELPAFSGCDGQLVTVPGDAGEQRQCLPVALFRDLIDQKTKTQPLTTQRLGQTLNYAPHQHILAFQVERKLCICNLAGLPADPQQSRTGHSSDAQQSNRER